MAKKTLTDRALKSLKPAKPGARYEIMDAVVPGMGVRVTPTGQRTFMLVARFGGCKNPTRRALGEYGALTLEGARKKARHWIELVRQARIRSSRKTALSALSSGSKGTHSRPLPRSF